MKTCHVCLAECADDAELCPICGAELKTEEAEASAVKEEINIIENPVLAASVEDVVTAEIFRDMLKENNIPFTCDEQEMKLVFGGGFVAEEIYVDEKDLEAAQNIYDEILNAEPIFDEDFDGETDFEEESE